MRALSLLCLVIVGSQASADTLVLKDGRMFDGIKIEAKGEFLVLAFEHGIVEVPRGLVLEFVSESGSDFVPTNDRERERVANGQVRYGGKWMSASSRAKRLEKDLATWAEDIKERKEGRLWRNRQIVETKNFIFESTAPPNVTEYYRELCEAYFQEFAKTWKIKRGKAGKLKLKFFVDQERYMQVTGVGSSTLGFFRYVEPYELCIFYDRFDPEHTEEILFHELGHYLQKLINVDFKYPHWPGEALSEYYGASSWDPKKKKVEVGRVLASRIEDIRYDIARDTKVTIEDLLSDAPNRNYSDYTWGWSLVHFLMNDKRYAKNFGKFYVALANGKNVRRGTTNFGRSVLKSVTGETVESVFRKFLKIKSDKAMDELQKDWYAHIDKNLVITSARDLENAAVRNLRFNRTMRGKRLFEEAIEMGTENPLTFHRYAELMEELHEPKKARENWELAIELDPLEARYYAALGEFLVGLGNQEEFDVGEGLLMLALDIEPDNFYLERNLKDILREGKRAIKRAKVIAEDD